MNLKFILNDYILMWNLLFQRSITKEIQSLKQKLWKSYRHHYQALQNEENTILKYAEDYIPDNDAIFEMVKSSECYQDIRNNTEKYRNGFVKSWDTYQKEILANLKDILKIELKTYNIYLVDPRLNIVKTKSIIGKDKTVNVIIWGRTKDLIDYQKALLDILHHILKREIASYEKEYMDIAEAIIELAIDNELATRLLGHSVYLRGNHELNFLKRQIYPYWLMYLGYSKEEMRHYMVRDSLSFDLDKYPYERELKRFDLYKFIAFCIRNQKYILKINELEII